MSVSPKQGQKTTAEFGAWREQMSEVRTQRHACLLGKHEGKPKESQRDASAYACHGCFCVLCAPALAHMHIEGRKKKRGVSSLHEGPRPLRAQALCARTHACMHTANGNHVCAHTCMSAQHAHPGVCAEVVVSTHSLPYSPPSAAQEARAIRAAWGEPDRHSRVGPDWSQRHSGHLARS